MSEVVILRTARGKHPAGEGEAASIWVARFGDSLPFGDFGHGRLRSAFVVEVEGYVKDLKPTGIKVGVLGDRLIEVVNVKAICILEPIVEDVTVPSRIIWTGDLFAFINRLGLDDVIFGAIIVFVARRVVGQLSSVIKNVTSLADGDLSENEYNEAQLDILRYQLNLDVI